jgi:hypothetical protein
MVTKSAIVEGKEKERKEKRSLDMEVSDFA